MELRRSLDPPLATNRSLRWSYEGISIRHWLQTGRSDGATKESRSTVSHKQVAPAYGAAKELPPAELPFGWALRNNYRNNYKSRSKVVSRCCEAIDVVEQ